jgi:hypothetical protein
MTTENKDTTQDTTQNIFNKLLCLIIGFAILTPFLAHNINVSKSRLRKYYNVDGKTFNKWYQYFCTDISNIDQFKKQRKITLATYWQIKSRLGDISDCAVMRKVDIVNLCESDYRTLRKNIKHAPPSVGIDIRTYDRLSAFPPKVCRAIIDWFG